MRRSHVLLLFFAVGCGAPGEIDESAAAFTDVTCGGRFTSAEPPYAKRPDGCSSWSNNPQQVRDSWGSADFRPTCNEHDRCYYTLGSDATACNDAFCSGLRRACNHAYCSKQLSICEPVTYGACLAIAETYCAAVRSTAPSVHADAQETQRNWEACLAEQGGLAPPPPPPPPCSNGKPEGATWSGPRDGMRCVIATYVCRGAKIVETSRKSLPNCIEP